MAINKKLIHFKTKQNFNNAVTTNSILDTSIVFIKDSKEIHTHGETYKAVNWSVLELPKGLFIYDIHGKYTLPSEWNTNRNDEAVGVAILGDSYKFVVAKEDTGKKEWGGNGTDIASLANYTSSTAAAMDFDGITNTSKIIAALGSDNAAGACASYTFPNGKKGYLGAAGEWYVARQNKAELNNALTLIGGTTMPEDAHWTSTEGDSSQAWNLWFDGDSNLYKFYKTNFFYTRAFLAV